MFVDKTGAYLIVEHLKKVFDFPAPVKVNQGRVFNYWLFLSYECNCMEETIGRYCVSKEY